MDCNRRDFLIRTGAAAFAAGVAGPLAAQPPAQSQSQAQQPAPSELAKPTGPRLRDRVVICNEDSNTLTVIDPHTNTVAATINLTSFDEDPRPPFRLVTGGVAPTHGAMIGKPLYHGAIHLHGAAPSPDNRLLACTGRGSSNIYLIDLETLLVLGNTPNPQAGEETNPERVSSGILVGREPHEPTFTRNGKEVWVALRGENRIAILDLEPLLRQGQGRGSLGKIQTRYFDCLDGPSQVWFSTDGRLAFVASQKLSQLEVIETQPDSLGNSRPRRWKRIDLKAHDPFGFTPFLKLDRAGGELWLSHKLADALSVWSADREPQLVSHIPLGRQARPNHLEFVNNAAGSVAYVSLARVDDDGPGGVPSSRIVVIDHRALPAERRVVATFFSHGREAHGLWTNPENTRLYVAHEQDELPNTPNAGQTVCSCFDVSDPLRPLFVAQIPLGELTLPSGSLRSKKSINLVYVRPGERSQTG